MSHRDDNQYHEGGLTSMDKTKSVKILTQKTTLDYKGMLQYANRNLAISEVDKRHY
jgi:hypothetical protein